MQVTETLSEGLKRAYVVVVPGTDLESRRAARLADLGKTLRLPGFRPGKVPLPVVRQRFGSAVNEEVLDESVEQATRQVLSERGLRPAMQPKVDVINRDAAGLIGGTDLEFKVEVELLPEIPPVEFGSIELTRFTAEVSPETVDKALGNIAERNRELIDISPEELGGRGAERGEFVRLDYVGKIDGNEFPGGRGNDVDVELGGAGFIPGFAEQLEGIRPGETRRIEVQFPEDYRGKEVAGKAASFEVTAKAVKRARSRAIDDELAKHIGFGDLDELKEVVRGQVKREYDELSRQRLKRDLLDALDKRVSFASPEGMVETEFSQIWARLEADRKSGSLDEEDRSKDEETLRAEYRAIAERRVRLGLLLAEIGRTNDVGVSPDEVTRAMRVQAAQFPGHEAQLMDMFRKNPAAADRLRGPLLEAKVVDFILSQVKVEDRNLSPEELAREAEKGPDEAEPSVSSSASAETGSAPVEPEQVGAAEPQPAAEIVDPATEQPSAEA
jgi:trigger factor